MQTSEMKSKHVRGRRCGGRFGADPRLTKMIFNPAKPVRQRAGSRAGAMSLITGVAARKSCETGLPVKISSLVKL